MSWCLGCWINRTTNDMSVIAWDGKTLAVDRQLTCADIRLTGTKCRKLANGEVVAWTGGIEYGMILARWYEQGADPLKWPAFQRTDEWSRLIVCQPSQVVEFEKEPEPQLVEEPFCAWGSGRDFAMGAMAMGATARRAVEVACRFNIHCGMGVDVFPIRRRGRLKGE